jgi:hypothetical protein
MRSTLSEAKAHQTRCIMKLNDFGSLLSEIVMIQLFYRRLNDVQIGTEVYSIIFKEVKDSTGKSEVKIFLRNSKKDDYALTVRQLAGLRIAVGTITSKWFEEFRDDAFGTTLQEKARELTDVASKLETMKFRVAHQLKVRNEFALGAKADEFVPVYQDRCYVGATDYSIKLRELTKGKTGNFWETPEYQLGVRDAREKLHATALKPGKDIEANIVKLPIFEIL